MNSKILLVACALMATAACRSGSFRHNDSKSEVATDSSSGVTASTAKDVRHYGDRADAYDTTSGTSSSMPSVNDQDQATNPSAIASGAVHAADQATVLQEGRDFLVLNFDKGAKTITEAEKASLRSLIETARANNTSINRIHVVAWSDKALPASKDASDISKDDRDLAKARLDVIESYLKDQQMSGIRTYSMAEKASWFARLFNTQDAELKSMFSQKGANNDVRPEEFQVVKLKGGPMKAVILLQKKTVMS